MTRTGLAADAYRHLGTLYLDAGDMAKSAEFFTSAFKVRPNFPEAHHDLALIYIRTQQLDKALAELQTSLQQRPDFGPAVLNLALVYQMRNDVPSARKVLEAYLAQFGSRPSDYLGQIRDRLSKLPS